LQIRHKRINQYARERRSSWRGKHCEFLTETRLNSQSNGASFATVAVPLIYRAAAKEQFAGEREARKKANQQCIVGVVAEQESPALGEAMSIARNWINEKYLSIVDSRDSQSNHAFREN